MKLVIAALGVVAVCRAVSCGGPVTNCQRLSSSSVFFVGKAIKAKATGRHRFTGNRTDPEILSVRYQVVRAFAGVTPGQIVVVEDTWAPEPGRRVFVEAYRFEGKIETSVCDMGGLGESLQQFLERRAAGRGDPTSLTVYVSTPFGPGDFAVSIGGPVQRQGRSSKVGLRFAPIPPGRYVVEAEGEGYEAQKTETVDVIAGGCGVADVQMEGTGRASGIVRDDSGKVAPGALVSFEREDSWGNKKSWDALSGDQGQYEVIGLPPGKFRVAIRHPRVALTTYYPQVGKPEQAELIDILPGGSVTAAISLIPEVPRAWRIRLVWQDGTPLADKPVYMTEIAGPSQRIVEYRSDKEGVVVFDLIGGGRYRKRLWTDDGLGIAELEIAGTETTAEATVQLRQR